MPKHKFNVAKLLDELNREARATPYESVWLECLEVRAVAWMPAFMTVPVYGLPFYYLGGHAVSQDAALGYLDSLCEARSQVGVAGQGPRKADGPSIPAVWWMN